MARKARKKMANRHDSRKRLMVSSVRRPPTNSVMTRVRAREISRRGEEKSRYRKIIQKMWGI